MIKRYCDFCEVELDKTNKFEHEMTMERTSKSGAKATIKLHCKEHDAVVIETGIVPDLCKYCVLDIVNKIDDRPRSA